MLNVEKNVKFHSNQIQADRFIAENVTQKNARQDHHHQDDIELVTLCIKFPIIHYFFHVILFCLVVSMVFLQTKAKYH